MQASANPKLARPGFTLVELLVVVLIIGILAGLFTVAGMGARRAVIDAAMVEEEGELHMSLQSYKNEYRALPPSFANVNHTDVALRTAARSAVLRHLRRAFPRLQIPGSNVDTRWGNFCALVSSNYQVWNPLADDGAGGTGDFEPLDPNKFDAASSLLFWLGGLPEQASTPGQWIPAGFHADPNNPFKPGLPRTKPLFDFDHERIVAVEPHPDAPDDPDLVRYLRYYPKWAEPAPYVYFKAQRVGANWDYGAVYDASGGFVNYGIYYQHATGSLCVPYFDPNFPQLPRWRNYDTCQIIAAGRDGLFGSKGPTVPRVSVKLEGFSQDDFDNIASFSDGTLEDETE